MTNITIPECLEEGGNTVFCSSHIDSSIRILHQNPWAGCGCCPRKQTTIRGQNHALLTSKARRGNGSVENAREARNFPHRKETH